LSSFNNRSYYIPVLLIVEVIKEKSFYTIDIKADVKHIELNELKVTDTVNEDYDKYDDNKYDDDEYDDDEYDDDAYDDTLLLNGNLLFNSDLSSGGLSLNNKYSLDDNASSDDVRSLSNNDLSDNGLLLNDDSLFDEFITNEDKEDYKREEGKEGEDDTDADL